MVVDRGLGELIKRYAELAILHAMPSGRKVTCWWESEAEFFRADCSATNMGVERGEMT